MLEEEARQQFLTAMLTRELTLSSGKSLLADGNWHRCNANNTINGNNDGSYLLSLAGPVPFGLLRNWTDGKGVDSWHGSQTRPLNEAERRDLEHRIEQSRAEHERQAAELAAQARDKAQYIWDRAEAAPADHDYLKRKQIKPHGLRVDEYGHLLVPMYADNELVNLQLIGPNGSKFYLRGGRAKGCYCRIAGDFARQIVTGEGFATVASVSEAVGCLGIVAFSAGNLEPVATAIHNELRNADAAIWKDHEAVAEETGLSHDQRRRLVDVKLVIVADDDWQTKGNPGLMAALRAGRVARALVAMPSFVADERKPSDTDFNDLVIARGVEAVKAAIEAAVEPDVLIEEVLLADPHQAFGEAWVKELAGLKQADRVRYERLLEALKAEKIRAAQLDRLVKAALTETEDDDDDERPDELYPHWSVEPWPDRVDTHELLQDISAQITKYVATLGDRALVPALWIAGTYVHEVATHSPLLMVTSPEPDSGKSTLLGVVGFLARKALLSVNISGPALFRALGKWQPTFIVDEADTALINNDDLKEVMNSGWTRGQGVIRCDPETNDPRVYSTFSPKAIGMKGKKLPDTTLSRAVIIEMVRKQPGEVVHDFNHLDCDAFKTLRSKLVRWAADNAQALKSATPKTPPGFYNRTRMNWWLLLAISELAGVEDQARKAAQLIEAKKDKNRASLGVMLLADLRALFDQLDVPMLLSRVIVQELTADEEKPWATYRRDKPLTQRQLANLLGDFQIIPEEVHPGGNEKHGKGYLRARFEEVWGRYLADGDTTKSGEADDDTTKSGEDPPFDPRERANPSAAATSTPFRSARENRYARIETGNFSYRHSSSRVRADRTHKKWGDEEEISHFAYRPTLSPDPEDDDQIKSDVGEDD